MIITGPRSLYFSTNFASLSQLISFYSLPPIRGNGVVGFEIDHNDSAVTLALVLGWVAAGGTLTGLPTYFSFTDTAYARNVPDGVPNDMTSNDNDGEVKRTWAQWHDSTHSHLRIGNLTYVPSNSFGTELDGDNIAQLHALSGVNAMLTADYVALLPSDGGV